MNELTS